VSSLDRDSVAPNLPGASHGAHPPSSLSGLAARLHDRPQDRSPTDRRSIMAALGTALPAVGGDRRSWNARIDGG
jgi:hypothetical protein